MAILEDGFYKICFVPDGMYAAGTKMRDPVKVESSPNPQIWQVTRRDNGNYMITKEEEFGVAWSLANLTRSYSSQYSASVVGKICLENPDETFALKLKDEAVKEDAVYSMRVSSNSPTISDSSFVIVSGQMVQVITQDPPSIKDIPYIWKFEFVRPI